MSTKTITLEEAAEAIRKNGWAKAASWGNRDPKTKKLISGCAIAQGAENLGCTSTSLREALGKITVFSDAGTDVSLDAWIMSQNDSTKRTVADIGEEVVRRTRALRKMPITVTAK